MPTIATQTRPLGGPGRPSGAGPVALGAILLGGATVAIVAAVTASQGLALAMLFAAVLAWAITRWTAASLIALFAMTSAYGSIQAYEHVNPRPFANLLVIAMWLAVLWHFAAGRQRRVWLWPGLLILPLYVILTGLEISTANTLDQGLRSFELSALPMSIVLLIAISPWPEDRLLRAVRGVLVVAGIIGAYNLYRWIVGPAPEELLFARHAAGALPHHIALRFFGNFPSAQGLASWCAIAIPFALAMGLAWRGRWRLLSAVIVGTCGFALIATSVLTSTFAAIAGIAVVIVLYGLARAFPGGSRLAAVLLVILAVTGISITGYSLAVSGSSKSESKFARILDPTSDPTFQERQRRWNEALNEVDQHPFGTGLGTVATVGGLSGTRTPGISTQLDSSYVKIAFEQGVFVLAFFVLALVTLLGSTAHRAVMGSDPTRVAVAIGACGVLTSIMVQFFGGFYIERLHMFAAWTLIGLGVAQFTGHRMDEALAARRVAPEPASA